MKHCHNDLTGRLNKFMKQSLSNTIRDDAGFGSSRGEMLKLESPVQSKMIFSKLYVSILCFRIFAQAL